MTPAEVLRAARKLIERPENWVKGYFIDHIPGCRRFCATGAIRQVSNWSYTQADTDARDYLARAADTEYIVAWNDQPNRTHVEVLAAFDAAIALANQETQP